ncbi:hypothetical protein QEH56_04780 [Pelagicoccus enzymogenes]|uniref:WD40/YVTN/BNR-like repeat-containing protein n=1 Tax=Pelagicoccus enzymogenes TaxID=2773457 RepID=UPI00280F823F|nr:hypothetical protein [Pelagicoccus enzymogenes]MDQ8197449.1 hypothetical protein [Pelagicoccus enzymogenes]
MKPHLLPSIVFVFSILCCHNTSRGQGAFVDELTPWESVDLDPSLGVWDIDYVDGRFLSISGRGELMLSADGLDWESKLIDIQAAYRTIEKGDDGYCVTASKWSDELGRAVGALAFSTNLEEWELVNLTAETRSYNDVAFGDGVWVAVGDEGAVARREVGGDWESSQLGALGYFKRIAFGNGVFVAINYANAVLLSQDGGKTWSERSLPEAGIVHSVAYERGVFILSGSSVFISKDAGQTWESGFAFKDTAVRGASFDGERYFASGTERLSPLETISWDFYSDDGLAWQRHLSSSSDQVNDLVLAGGRAIVVGEGKAIRVSQQYLDGYAVWIRQQVTDGEAALLEQTADPDRDRVANLFEYATGSQAFSAESRSELGVYPKEEYGSFGLSMVCRSSDPQLSFRVYASDDLSLQVGGALVYHPEQNYWTSESDWLEMVSAQEFSADLWRLEFIVKSGLEPRFLKLGIRYGD